MMFCIYPGISGRPIAMNQKLQERLVKAQLGIRRSRRSLGNSLAVVRHVTWTVLAVFV